MGSAQGSAQPNWQAEGAGIAEADPVTREPSSRRGTRFSARPCGPLRFNSAREMLVVMCTLPVLAGENISSLSAFASYWDQVTTRLPKLALSSAIGSFPGRL